MRAHNRFGSCITYARPRQSRWALASHSSAGTEAFLHVAGLHAPVSRFVCSADVSENWQVEPKTRPVPERWGFPLSAVAVSPEELGTSQRPRALQRPPAPAVGQESSRGAGQALLAARRPLLLSAAHREQHRAKGRPAPGAGSHRHTEFLPRLRCLPLLPGSQSAGSQAGGTLEQDHFNPPSCPDTE